MTEQKTVLLLYPTAADQSAGQALKQAFQEEGLGVEELVVDQNYAEVLDRLEQPVIPLVAG